MSDVSITDDPRVEMADTPPRDDQGSERPQHTIEEEKAFGERIRTLAGYVNLASKAVRQALKNGSRGWVLYLAAFLFLLVLAAVVFVAVYYSGSGEDLTGSLLDDTSALTPEDSGTQELVSLTGQPWIFYASDQGIFTICFEEDGTCSVPDWPNFVYGNYAESELHIELTLHRRLTQQGTVVDWDEWFYMDRVDDVMKGTWEAESWVIDPDGNLNRMGIALMPHDVVARPK